MNKPERYECIKELIVDKYDEDGFFVDGEYIVIPKGSIWERDETSYRIAGGPDTVRLDLVVEQNAVETQWLEILEETLEEHFRKVGKE